MKPGNAIEIHDLYKEFRLNHTGIASLKTLLTKRHSKSKIQILNVLNGITFDIPKGQSTAIIGRNGAGKSTLLALIAQIYLPTKGSIEVDGRVAPLLELGAGFHPDLTGLENIFVNGMILGMTRKELESKLDEIIDFSEIRRLIDSPVRTYSSGMSARLGFAIAAHADAEVLLVDEALAVGDFEFRSKCYKKIRDLRSSGKTILVVSHGTEEVRNLADRCIWIQHGKVQADGAPDYVLKEYEKNSVNTLG